MFKKLYLRPKKYSFKFGYRTELSHVFLNPKKYMNKQ